MSKIDLKLFKEDFERRLQEKYNGRLKPLKAFTSDRIVMYFKCRDCQQEFFARPSYLLEIESQSHICGMPYGSMKGKRVSQVINGNSKRKRKTKPKVKPETINKNLGLEIDELLSRGVPAAKIATKLKVNPAIMKYYIDHLWKND